MAAPFSNAAKNLRQLRTAHTSWACAGLILAIQTLVEAVGGPDRQPARAWFEQLALQREGFLAGKLWEIATYAFLHGAWWHAGINAAFLLLIGSRIEHMVGPRHLLKAIAAGILGGGLSHLLLGPAGSEAPLLVGASGGCVALLLLLTTLSPQSRMMPFALSGRVLGIGILIVELLFALMDPSGKVPGFSVLGQWLATHGLRDSFGLGHACHFGGGLAGLLYGKWLLRPRVSLQRLRRDRERRESATARRVD